MPANELERQNKRLLAKLLVIVVMMGGVSYLMVPMYRQICESLGITQSRVVSTANLEMYLTNTLTD